MSEQRGDGTQVDLLRATHVEARLREECIFLTGLLPRCPETLRGDLEGMIAARQDMLQRVQGVVRETLVVLPEDVTRYLPPEEPIALEPEREG
jgi:N-methylhydantoinase B/oxoprolinase/acetone carboxylase alpha subunit